MLERVRDAVGASAIEYQEGKNHPKLIIHKGGKTSFVVCGGTPSDWRALKNIERDIKRQAARMDNGA